MISPKEDNWDAIDELSLQVLECLIIKEDILNGGPRQIDNRRKTISSALVNYLIILMLESMECNDRAVRIPSPLILLVRYQLCGRGHPELYGRLLSQHRKNNAAHKAAERLQPGEKLTIHKLMDFASIGQGTAARYLKDPIFQHDLKEWQKITSSKTLKGDGE